jgi:hypothetical protein
VNCTVALEPLPISGTSTVSRRVPQILVRARIETGIASPARLPMWITFTESSVAVAAAELSSVANRASEVRRREAGSSSRYIWPYSSCSHAVT